ncbi:hypothetical protein Ddye_015419 [Dipteronia dyeriana]|uniref:non-specific serine/threonine protein kinase n=1 Tax=Dipteronia dyeriana TaxID=168575 RepID=A0AAD9U4S8_9ROSI|nr:hypothetical protein Ddye_015419 [Dipteronia dyeriana]
MKTSLSPSLILHSNIITFLFFIIAVPVSYCEDDAQYKACSHPYACGSSIHDAWYPFWGNGRPLYCGRQGFELKCHENKYPIIQSATQKFQVLNINQSGQTMTMARVDLSDDYCTGILQETTFSRSLFQYGPNVEFINFFYDCSGEIRNEPNTYNCSVGIQLQNLTSYACMKSVQVPVRSSTALENYLQNRSSDNYLQEALNQGFDVVYQVNNSSSSCSQCLSSLGICGSDNSTSEEFLCFCIDKPYALSCDISGVAIAIGAGTTIICIIFWMFRSKISSIAISRDYCFRNFTNNDQELETFIRNYGPLAIIRYNFTHVKKMTDSFKDKLGQGGYATVYKGKLEDDQLVAVKLLNTSKGNGKDFINEVASICKTSHVNVVKLLGFCLECNKRALIYELMPNGSLEKFIYNEDSLNANHHLGFEKLYKIALGIAKGLEYLHRGCNTRILHMDIKPDNILLDEEFFPKISDFGLAKLCPRKESIVSISEARGTIGYTAPEVFSRNFGEVSHKADVYSYGMMVLEMVGGRKNFHRKMDNTSEIYFPEWIYKHVERGEEIKLRDGMSRDENEITKKMIFVGLWCIQTLPLDRPSMNKVIDMLHGSIEALPIPPNPFLFSPSRPSIASSTVSMS